MLRSAVRTLRHAAERRSGVVSSSLRYNAAGVLPQATVSGIRLPEALKILRNSLSAVPQTVDLDTNSADLAEHKSRGEISQAQGQASFTQLPATKQGQKPRVVVLGSGWAACRLMKDLNTDVFDIVCISPRNHMVFTPLLASTCVGTLEFRSVSEPVRSIQPALSKSPDSFYFHARCTNIDPESNTVSCEVVDEEIVAGKRDFNVAYDKLVIASGAEPLTFGIKGVSEHATFLREVPHAREIRNRLLTNLMLSDIPGVPIEEKKRLLHCVVVGGGPTGVEFSGELSDFIRRDVHEKHSHVKDYIQVTLIEANEILSSFDVRLRQYAVNHLGKTGVKLLRGIVKEVFEDRLVLSDGTVVPYGVLVWSTGVGPSTFVKKLEFEKSPGGRIGINDNLRLPAYDDIYAIGDCAGYVKETNKTVLPALAQVAERQGRYLATSLNKIGLAGCGRAKSGCSVPLEPFVYEHMGIIASIGRYKALVDLRESPNAKGIRWAGFLSWVMWRSAYLTRVISWRNRFYVAVNWLTTFVFGRDISKF